jgi:hypothetical protein
MRRVCLSKIAIGALLACSSPASRSTQPVDSGMAYPDAGSNAKDSGPDAAAIAAMCDSPDATPTLPCGTLAFAKSPVVSRARNHHVTLLVPTSTGTMLYALAGFNNDASGETLLPNVDRAPIDADGSLGAWVSDLPLPDAIASAGPVGQYVSGVIVIAGGLALDTNTGMGAVTDVAYSSVVNTDGSLAGWNAAGTIVEPRMHAGSIVQGNRMWILGGFDGNSNVWSDVVSATVQSDGTVSMWAPAGQLPGPLTHFGVALVDNYVYLTGGLSESPVTTNQLPLATTWRGQIEADGTLGSWKAMPTLPVGESTHAAFSYGGYLHICGGINANGYEDRCWRSPIGSDHALGVFEQIESLPISRGHVHQMPLLGSNVYSVAGAIDSNLDSTTEIDIGTFGPVSSMKRTSPPRPSATLAEPVWMHGSVCHGRRKQLRLGK